MEYAHGKIMVDPEELNLALSLADEAGEQLSRIVADAPAGADGWREWTRHRIETMQAAAQVAQAREARALRLTLAKLADDHEYNADRRADR